jgi:hypothetical protein
MESLERVEIELPNNFMDANIDHLALLIGTYSVPISKTHELTSML